METSASDMLLGIHKNLSQSPFIGSIDEVNIYDRALSASEIYALAQSEVAGVTSVELALESFDFHTGTATSNGLEDIDWQPATLDQPGARLSTWSYPIPENLEDFYHINIRGRDAYGNTSGTGTVWRGTIDTLDPRISFSVQHRGGGSAAQTAYTFTVDDLFLDEASLVHPCAENELVPGYDDNSGRLSQISSTCKVAGHQTDPVSVTACDIAGHCTTEAVTLPTPSDIDGVAILTPTSQSVVTSGVPVSVAGGGFATAGIRDVTLSVDGSEIGVVSLGGAVTDAPWEVIWTPTVIGTSILTAVMTDSVPTAFTDTITVAVVPITVNSLNDPGDGTCDATECTLREAIALAGNGATIDISITGTITLTRGRLTINQDLTITGPGAADLTIDANHASGVFNIARGTVAISGVTIVNGRASEAGGIDNRGVLTLNNSTVSGNAAATGQGGGVLNIGTLTLNHSTVSDNLATAKGGGIDNQGMLALNNSTVSSNETDGDGGGISNSVGSTLTLTNTTISGNSATSEGGGIWNDGTLTMDHSTVNDNSSGTLTMSNSASSSNGPDGGGIWSSGTGEINIKNSIVANNLAGGDCSGGIISLGHNLDSDASCGLEGTGDLPNTDPKIHHLQHNGGHTLTHALLPGSPAIDAIPGEHCVDHEGNAVATDQRGVGRRQGEACDIGAYEFALGIITGAIYLQGRTDHSGVLIEADGFTTFTDAEGAFTFDAPVDVHETVTASMPGYLSAQAVNVEVGVGATTTLSDAILPSGDTDADNSVSSVDLRFISMGFAQEMPSGITVDINGDGRQDLVDLVLVALNFGKVGPINWTVAE